VTQVYLAMDGDPAGKAAAVKIGHLFQKKGIGVSVVPLPKQSDPDTYIATCATLNPRSDLLSLFHPLSDQ